MAYGVRKPSDGEVAAAVVAEPVEVRTLRRTERASRASRRLPCGHHVPPGTPYTEWVGLVDGRFTTMVECALCRGEHLGLPPGRYSVLP